MVPVLPLCSVLTEVTEKDELEKWRFLIAGGVGMALDLGKKLCRVNDTLEVCLGRLDLVSGPKFLAVRMDLGVREG